MYNKVEALREKADAEKLIGINDYVGAREKLLKAQNLFPSLEHIPAMMTVCDVLSAARTKIPGFQIDYYWVLNIMPSASPNDLKLQYDRLINLLQPMKGKFCGTLQALKFVEEAFSVLSDRTKRLIFDSRRASSWDAYESFANPSRLQPGTCAAAGVTAQRPLAYDNIFPQVWNVHDEEGISMPMHQEMVDSLVPNLQSDSHAIISSQESTVVSSDINSEGHTREDTDLSVDDLNSSLRPPTTGMMSNLDLSSEPVLHKKLDQDFFNFEDNRGVECFKIGQIRAVHYHVEEDQNYLYAQINTISKSTVGFRWLKPVPVGLYERRWCDAGLPVACGSFYLDLDVSEQMCSPTAFTYNCSWIPGVTEKQFEIYPRKGEVWALYEDWDLEEWCYNPEKIKGCRFTFVEILSDFSKYLGVDGACLSKVDGCRSIFKRENKDENPLNVHISPENLYLLSHVVPAYKFTGGEIDGVDGGMIELDLSAISNNNLQDIDSQLMPRNGNTDNSDFTSTRGPVFSRMPNAQHTKVGHKWSLNDFAAGQVWAVYFGQDLMPRRYAQMNSVISETEVCVTLLELQSVFSDDFNRKAILPIVCGTFQAKETSVNLKVSQLSHKVKCQMSINRPIFNIYPKKGDVWAMYQNWNSNWKPADYENYKCLIVEILSDFSDNERMTIVKLGEVKGYLTFFRRIQRDGFDMSRLISKADILSFSHQIPAYRVPGIKRYGIPEDSWHLEPTALPPPIRATLYIEDN